MEVLIIDDEPEVLQQIEKVISQAKGADGEKYQVTEAKGVQEAFDILEYKERPFAVVVTDMIMGEEADEGLQAVEKIADISPIKIILTAHASIPNCVKAMRFGAWDYLEKNPLDDSDPYENLLNSITDACKHRAELLQKGKVNPETKWIQKNMSKLLAEHGGEVIAVLDERLVDHDKNYDTLNDRVKKAYPYADVTLIALPDTKKETI